MTGRFDPPEEPLDLPLLPYGGTSGHAGTDTSRDRALAEDQDGTTADRQRRTMGALFDAVHYGRTWRELAAVTGLHHGSASSSLSILHKEGKIARLTETRDRCKVYVHLDYVEGRPTEPYGNPARPTVAQMIAAIEHAYEALVAAGQITQADCTIAGPGDDS